ncbi:hypothetical protein PoB_005390600 [Plakobranchus ocellatus]|uniref:DDE-1 domain-containing protein n=1 Tax=Plakobranchus ocellatus TaxID=259542 RepID=A0AAV4BW45_9GAST|nr:hypothetical protein PoB_005390600 [Plakobranchus ocellatus]
MLETSELGKANGIILYRLKAHSSHLIQPLDQSFFGVIEPARSSACKRFMFESGEGIGLENFAEVLVPVGKRQPYQNVPSRDSYRVGCIHSILQKLLIPRKSIPRK